VAEAEAVTEGGGESQQGKMTDGELLNLIAAYERGALGSSVAAGATISTTVYPSQQQMTTLEIDRYNAINGYFARPLGNEVENRSQVVLPELRDTIEWIKPQLMRMFVSSKEICRFDPENAQDIEQAKLETAAVNHVFMKENNGFFVLHDFFMDAMLMRNGYVSVSYIEEEHTGVESYSGLTQMEVTQLLADMDEDETEILEQREYDQEMPIGAPGTPIPGIPAVSIKLFDLRIRRTETKGRVCVKCLPPEEVLVSPRARESLDGIPFVCHKTETPRSELIEDGHDKAVVNALPTGKPNWLEIDALARNIVTDQLSVENPADKAMQTVEVRNVTIMVDYDGDGVAELRHVLVAGDKILENEEIEECPMASCSPIRMPHRHTGISFYDLIMDLQVIKTVLFRQGLDNLYLANNMRIGVDWQNCSIDDLLTSRPGGVVRTKGNPADVLFPLQQESNLVSQVMPALEYIDKLRAGRTGVGEHTMGVDADELQNVTKGAALAAQSSASLKIELLARLLAEGVKEIFTKIHGAMIRHQQAKLNFELSGKWVEVDPSQWRRRTKVTANVGLGSGNREEMRANLQLVAQAQQALAQMGLVGPKQAYASFSQLCESMGFQQPELFAMDPAGPEYAAHMQAMANQPQHPNPMVQVAQIKSQSAEQIAQLRFKADQMKAQADQMQSQAELEHAALQTHAQLKTDQASNKKDYDLTIIKALAQMIRQQIKGQQENAGQLLEQDFQAAQGIEQRQHEMTQAQMSQSQGQ
jgi:hypothetical protein